MSDERKKVDNGARAQRLMEDPLLLEAYNEARSRIIAAWPNETDAARREELWLELRGLDRVWTRLKDRVTTGKFAQKALEDRDGR